MTKSLAYVALEVCDLPAQIDFYCDVLGMKVHAKGAGFARVGFIGEDADLMLLAGGAPYKYAQDHRYWKIGITLPNVDMATAALRARGVTVTDPRQFQEIGYMGHLSDPEGFQIELLQHDFQTNRPPDAGDEAQPLGGARVGQITLRTNDLSGALASFKNGLGMRLLSVQPVRDYDFTLYFLAFTDEQPPVATLESVENREWLWKRPYTTLELQHLSDLPEIVEGSGYAGIGIKGVAPIIDEIGRATILIE